VLTKTPVTRTALIFLASRGGERPVRLSGRRHVAQWHIGCHRRFEPCEAVGGSQYRFAVRNRLECLALEMHSNDSKHDVSACEPDKNDFKPCAESRHDSLLVPSLSEVTTVQSLTAGTFLPGLYLTLESQSFGQTRRSLAPTHASQIAAVAMLRERGAGISRWPSVVPARPRASVCVRGQW